MEKRLIGIHQRWRAAKALQTWRGLPESQRDRLLGQLEDMQRELQCTGDPASVALAAAVDLLDTVAIDGSLATWDEATADVHWLLEQLDAAQRRR